MSCNCSLTEKIIGALVILVAWWNPLGYTKWVLTVLGALLIIHAFRCTNCKIPPTGKGVAKKPITKAVVKKKKK